MKKILFKSVLLVVILSFFMACEDDDPNVVKITTENINPAANNDAIIAQQKYYISGQTQSSVYEIITDHNGKFYFYGSDGIIGEIDYIGTLKWQKNVGYKISDFKLIKGFLVCVGTPSNSSNVTFFKDFQKISCFNTSGSLLDEYSMSLSNYRLRIYSVVSKYETFSGLISPPDSQVSSYDIVVGGAASNGNDFYPYFTTLQIDKTSGKISSSIVNTDVLLKTKSGIISRNFKIRYSVNEGFTYYSILQRLSSDSVDATTKNTYLAKINPTGMQEVWDKELKGENDLKFTFKDMFVQNNYTDTDPIYLVGETESLTKGKDSDASDYWTSGYVYSIDYNGATNFQKAISYSIKCEAINDIAFSQDGYLYLCGIHSNYYLTNTNDSYSNGLVVKMDRSGNIQKYWTLGDKTTESGFNTICMNGNNLLLGGYTYDSYKDNKFKNWLVVIAK